MLSALYHVRLKHIPLYQYHYWKDRDKGKPNSEHIYYQPSFHRWPILILLYFFSYILVYYKNLLIYRRISTSYFTHSSPCTSKKKKFEYLYTSSSCFLSRSSEIFNCATSFLTAGVHPMRTDTRFESSFHFLSLRQ